MGMNVNQASLAGRGPALLQLVATRIAEARKARGLPRRVLSEMSGVSPRYLAQLEAGEGNISILLLARVADALDLSIDEVVGQNAPLDHDARRMAALFAQAPEAVQLQVQNMLAEQDPGALRAGRVCLIGLRGAGKSTLGRLAGAALDVPFVELGKEIEAETAMPLAEVMALYGQDGYRRIEAEALERISARYDRLVLAVGGGIVAEPATYARLLARFHTVWIKTSPPEHMQRVRAQGDVRPMQGNPAAMSQLNELLTIRTPLYSKAEAQVDTSGCTERSSLKDLMSIISDNGFLDAS
jgi:XRE family aerobic/anaerobic benzoate catabolism transcriptional regulator